MSAQPNRQQFLGGSEAAGALGLSGWDTPLKVYLRKRDEAEPDTDNDRKRERILERGKREEPHIINDLSKLTPIKVTKRSTPGASNRYVDEEYPFLAAEIDAEWEVTREAVDYLMLDRGIEIDPALIGTTQNLEAKTAHPFVAMKKFGEEGTDEMPIEYFTQGMHGLGVTKRQVCLLALAVYVDDPILYVVKRDDETLARMRAKLAALWNDNILKGIPPEPINIADNYRMMKRRLATKIEATPAVAGMIQTLRVLKSRESVTQEAIEAVQFEIGTFILGAAAMDNPGAKDKGKHVVTVAGSPELTIAYQEQQRIDADALRLRYPAQAKECEKTSMFYKFNLKRSKP